MKGEGETYVNVIVKCLAGGALFFAHLTHVIPHVDVCVVTSQRLLGRHVSQTNVALYGV